MVLCKHTTAPDSSREPAEEADDFAQRLGLPWLLAIDETFCFLVPRQR